MDLGMVGVVDGYVGFSDTYCLPASSATTTSSLASDLETKNQKWYGSGFLKPSSGGAAYNGGAAAEDEDWKNLIKVAKADDFSTSRAMQLQNQKRSDLVPDGQHMLSFSSPNSQPYYHHSTSANTRNFAGYGSGGFNAASMNGVLAGVLRGPFTPSQWMELEHQALIYKYITANVPIPSNLLIPIKKALESAGFPSFSGPLGHSSLGWGAFRLGFSNSTDPEPGRCRRTDGKKWRCSRDAVQDHKYCERHMNRGRHRSRKPVEGQNGSAPAAAAATKHIPASPSTPSMGVPGGGASNTIGFSNHHPQLKNLQTGASNASCTTSPHIDRMFLNKDNVGERLQDATDLSMLPPTIGLKDNQFSIPKQQNSIYQESARSEFGRVCSDSLLNPLHKSSTLINCRNYGSSTQDQEEEPQYSVRQFMDDWPKSQTDRASISWPHIDNLQADRTQLSISILPTGASDSEKLALSPLRLPRELEMGLGVGSVVSEQHERQPSWMPLPCESSMGGPLGEVLHSSNNAGDYKNSSALNLMTGVGGGWDSSPPIGSSPTGVLQKVTFRSLSNSSAGSSPRAESHRMDLHP